MYSKKEFAIVSILKSLSMKKFMLRWVEHEKNYNLGAWSSIVWTYQRRFGLIHFTEIIFLFLSVTKYSHYKFMASQYHIYYSSNAIFGSGHSI